jgi:hypothetical protein|tara:strand:- start:1406 stop:2302 length:897 start_codon:yes stop_codon:yes gene_type:complete
MLNQYFDNGRNRRSEQLLYEDLIIETTKMHGVDVYYLPREVVNKDTIFGDDIPSRYGHKYKIEMYIENAQGFEGERDIFTKFGVEIRDQATFIVARRRWKQHIEPKITNLLGAPYFRPKEGDIIYLPMSNSMFQIRMVEDEIPFYQLRNLATFTMQCELFEYSGEDFDTGIDIIDQVEVNSAYQYVLTLDSASSQFQIGETVTQNLGSGVTLSGEVQRWSDSDMKLYVAHFGASDGKFHLPTTTLQIQGATSGSVSTVLTSVEYLSARDQVADQTAEFDAFEDGFIDFSEDNPFGDAE